MVAARELSPEEIVPMSTMLKWMGEALLRGRFDVLSGFLSMGKATSVEKKELAMRRALFEAARDALERAPAAPGTPPGAAAGQYSRATAKAALIA